MGAVDHTLSSIEQEDDPIPLYTRCLACMDRLLFMGFGYEMAIADGPSDMVHALYCQQCCYTRTYNNPNIELNSSSNKRKLMVEELDMEMYDE